jgi:hypothetical protein
MGYLKLNVYRLNRSDGQQVSAVVEPTGWGKPYIELLSQVGLSGAELWEAYSFNDFDNPLRRRDEQRYEKRGQFGEIVRDKVMNSGNARADINGRLSVDYTANADSEWEQTYSGILAPESGFYVVTNDGVFHEGTLIPYETTADKEEAIKINESLGIPSEQTSYFWRPSDYNTYSEGYALVSRDFHPSGIINGRFVIVAGVSPTSPGDYWVASRPVFEEPQLLMEVDITKRR